MARRVALLVILGSLLLAVTACDGTPPEGASIDTLSASQQASDRAQQLLTTEDVEQLCGFTDLGTIPFDPASSLTLGDVNIVDASQARIVSVYLGDAESWEMWLTDGSSVAEPVDPPVGDEAFVGPSPDYSAVITLFAFRKGEQAVLIESGVDANGEVVLGTEELRAIADIIAARL